MKLYSSTPAYCCLIQSNWRADAAQEGYNACEWTRSGSWFNVLTGGPFVGADGTCEADCLHRHWWICDSNCLLLCCCRRHLIPQSTVQDLGLSGCPWDNVISCCVCAKDCMRYTPGGVVSGWTGCVLVAADDAGYVTWGTGGGGGTPCWEADGPTLLRPADSECCIMKKGVGTICFGLAACRWNEGYFDTILNLGLGGVVSWGTTPGQTEILGGANTISFTSDLCNAINFSSDAIDVDVNIVPVVATTKTKIGCETCLFKEGHFQCMQIANGASANRFACSDANGNVTWTSVSPGLWSDTTGEIQPFAAGCDIVPNGTACVGQSADTWRCGFFEDLRVTDDLTVDDYFSSAFAEVATCMGIAASPLTGYELLVGGDAWATGCWKSPVLNPTTGGAGEIGQTSCCWLCARIYRVNTQCTIASTCIVLNGFNLTASGSKTLATIEYEPDKYAMLKVDESPDVIFHDHGSNIKVIPFESCYIKFDCIFQKITEPGIDYNLQITPHDSFSYKLDKQENGFIINNVSCEPQTFDWFVRKIRRFQRNSRWLKNGKSFNPDEFTENEMNTLESYPRYYNQLKKANSNIIQDAWGWNENSLKELDNAFRGN